MFTECYTPHSWKAEETLSTRAYDRRFLAFSQSSETHFQIWLALRLSYPLENEIEEFLSQWKERTYWIFFKTQNKPLLLRCHRTTPYWFSQRPLSRVQRIVSLELQVLLTKFRRFFTLPYSSVLFRFTLPTSPRLQVPPLPPHSPDISPSFC